MSSSSKLHVIKASAGSGKTYRLTSDYLSLLFSPTKKNEAYSSDFRNILAVTFTVKATAEMKERIIRDLDDLAQGRNKAKCAEIAQKTGLTEIQIQQQAPKILSDILRDYSSFRIQTIDSFFREIISAFAVELDHGGNIEIDLDAQHLIDLALDQFKRNLEETKQQGRISILKWLKRLLVSELQNRGNTSGLDRTLRKFATEIFFSDSKLHSLMALEQYSDEEIQQWHEFLTNKKGATEQQLIGRVANFAAYLDEHSLNPADSFYKTFQSYYFKPDPTKYDGNDLKSVMERFGTNPNEKSRIAEIITGKRTQLVAKSNTPEVIAAWEQAFPNPADYFSELFEGCYALCKEINDYVLCLEFVKIYPLLRSLKQEADKYKKNNHLLTTADINQLLSQITASENPFIYEKIGTQIHHFMMDEFQDTNKRQWENFSPLLVESLANGHENFIVGDVKQSIYRFRGSDSSLLSHEVRETPAFAKYIQETNLDANWRSAKEVVEFNNLFFRDILAEETSVDKEVSSPSTPKDYTLVYQESNVKQLAQRAEHGYVSILDLSDKLCSKDNEEAEPQKITAQEEKNAYNELVRQSLRNRLDDLASRGYQPKDIAILTRKGAEATLIASMLTGFAQEAPPEKKANYNFHTDEALIISRSDYVQLLVLSLRLLAEPYTPSIIEGIRVIYQRLKELYPHCFRPNSDTNDFINKIQGLPAHGLSLYEAVTETIRILGEVPEEEEIYINGFLDLITEFSSRNTSIYSKFISWWENVGKMRSVTMADDVLNAITIITIHKSKGLEYPVVILPFCNWSLKRNIRGGWRDIFVFDIPPSIAIPNFPAQLFIPGQEKIIRESHFSSQLQELDHAEYLDSLNLLYVAFTRAALELHVFIQPDTTKSNKSALPHNDVSQLVKSRISKLPALPQHNSEFAYEYGEATSAPIRHETTALTLSPGRLCLRDDCAHLSLDTSDNLFYSAKQQERQHGIIMHNILSRIIDAADAYKVINKYKERDEAYRKVAEELEERWSNVLASPITAPWFNSNQYQILVERPIFYGGQVIRPDRVMISANNDEAIVVDYKFGQENPTKYTRQIQQYMKAIKDCGIAQRVKGYLWYDLTLSPQEIQYP